MIHFHPAVIPTHSLFTNIVIYFTDEFHMLQSISFGSGFALCLEWILLPEVSSESVVIV